MNRGALMSLALGASLVSAAASADNLLGLYAGAGVGESTVRSDYGFDPDYPDDSHPHHTAWKAVVGIRPLPFIGAEAEYLDFGHSSSADSYDNRYDYYGYQNNDDSHPKAGILYGVGYLPLPFVDVFVKAGVARLQTTLRSYGPVVCNDNGAGSSCGPELLARDRVWQTRPAYGVGVQGHIVGIALRAEYERLDSKFGDPDALMVSATWTF